MGKIRTFIALNIEKSLKEKFRLIQDDVKILLENYPVKWTNSDKFHLTLRFLGDVDEIAIKNLITELSKIKPGFDKLQFKTSGIDFFPNRKYPNVVFADLSESGDDSGKLIVGIDGVITAFGIEPDKKFVPHITLGRFKHEGKRKLTDKIDISFEQFEIEFRSFFLMKSILRSGGPEYEVIKEFKLQ